MGGVELDPPPPQPASTENSRTTVHCKTSDGLATAPGRFNAGPLQIALRRVSEFKTLYIPEQLASASSRRSRCTDLSFVPAWAISAPCRTKVLFSDGSVQRRTGIFHSRSDLDELGNIKCKGPTYTLTPQTLRRTLRAMVAASSRWRSYSLRSNPAVLFTLKQRRYVVQQRRSAFRPHGG
jgi:hypothetical protein